MVGGLIYEFIDRKLVAQLQNRIGPRWFQPAADIVKLLAKEEVVPEGVNTALFQGLPHRGAGRRAHRSACGAAIWAGAGVQLRRRPGRHRLPAEHAHAVHRAGRRKHRRPLFADRRDAHPDPALLLRSAVPAGAAGPPPSPPARGRSARSTPTPARTG